MFFQSKQLVSINTAFVKIDILADKTNDMILAHILKKHYIIFFFPAILIFS